MKIVAVVLIAVGLVVEILQYRAIKRLAAENAALRAELKGSFVSSSSVETNEVRNPEEARAGNVAPPASTSPDSETLRLRGELAAVGSELARKTNPPPGIRILSEAEFETFHASMAPEDVRQVLTFDSLHDAGAQTPEAVVQSYLWTVRLTMDPATFAAANDRVKQIVYQPPGSNYGGFGAGVKDDPLRDSKILKIEAVTYPTSDTAKVRVTFYNDLQGSQSSTIFRVVRVADEWKMDFGIGRC